PTAGEIRGGRPGPPTFDRASCAGGGDRALRLGRGSDRLLPLGRGGGGADPLRKRHRHEAPRRHARGRSRGEHAGGGARPARSRRRGASRRAGRRGAGACPEAVAFRRGAAPASGAGGLVVPAAPPRARGPGAPVRGSGRGRPRDEGRKGRGEMNRGGTAVESRAGSLDRPLSFRANVSWSFFGTLAHAGSRWLGLVVLARLGGAETVGTLALATAIASPIFALTNLQLRQIQATDASGRFSFSTVFGLRLLTSALALGGVGLYAALASARSELVWVLWFVALAQGFESLSEVIYGRLQRNERLDRVARSMAAHGFSGIVALGVGYFATQNLVVAAAGMATGSLATFLFLDLPSLGAVGGAEGGRGALRPRLPKAELLPLLRSALPLGGTMMLVSLNGQIPRYFLEGSAGRTVLGVFAALHQLVAVGNLVISAIATAASPRLANYAHRGDRAAFR